MVVYDHIFSAGQHILVISDVFGISIETIAKLNEIRFNTMGVYSDQRMIEDLLQGNIRAASFRGALQ